MARHPGTRAERRQAIHALLEKEPTLSSREIARRCGSDPKTVRRLRQEHEGPGAPAVVTPAANAPAGTPRLVPQGHGGTLSMPPPQNERAVKHGTNSPRLVGERADVLAAELRTLVPGYQDADQTTVRLLALCLARIEMVTEWIDLRGSLFKDTRGNGWPILRNLSTWESSARALCDALGLTPTARARLGVTMPGTDGYASFLEAMKAESGTAVAGD